MNTQRTMSHSGASENNGVKLIIAWLFVGIPLLWGVVETGTNAMKLFQ